MIFPAYRATCSIHAPAVETTKAMCDDRDRPAPRDRTSVDRRAFLDVESVDLLAMRAGLMGDEDRAEQALRLAHVLDRLHHLDAAGLAAPPSMDLRLDHDDRPRSLAALAASSTEKAACPRGTGTPKSRSTALA